MTLDLRVGENKIHRGSGLVREPRRMNPLCCKAQEIATMAFLTGITSGTWTSRLSCYNRTTLVAMGWSLRSLSDHNSRIIHGQGSRDGGIVTPMSEARGQ